MRKNKSFEFRAFNPRVFLAFILFSIGASLALAAAGIQLVPGTAVLLSNSSGGGGNGGNTSSTTSSTNIFSPSVFVDYKRFGGEPTVTVDRYPGGNDVTYVSGPNGFVFPHYSPFFKSSDLGETFRIPAHVPSFGQTFGTGGGGGDSYQDVGQVPTDTTCPDPLDVALQVAGPPVVDYYNTHYVYIPFVRATPIIPGVSSGPPYSLWVAKSTDGGSTWTRKQVADLGAHNPVNLFPKLPSTTPAIPTTPCRKRRGRHQNQTGLMVNRNSTTTSWTTEARTWV